jgi:hypothetical protein
LLEKWINCWKKGFTARKNGFSVREMDSLPEKNGLTARKKAFSAGKNGFIARKMDLTNSQIKEQLCCKENC